MAVNIKLSKEQQQYLVLAVLVLGGGGFSYVRYFWMPLSAKIADTEAQIHTVEGKIQKAKNQAVRLNKIQKELDTLNEQAAQAEKRLPKSPDLAGVIDTVTDLARRYDVQLQSFAAGVPRPQAHFIETAYAVSARTTYHQLGRFFASLALQERIYNVRGVIYGAPDARGVMTVSFQLLSYQYKG
ncbi:MAG: type 4a pilus biogenesis protein PilO [Elusimicrobia bacterium]|nr:type 4a pilus biogenesis protein PilO [Elusimicrobiota bacterium]